MERVRNRRSAVSACRPGCSASGHAGGQDLRKVVRCSSCPCSRHPHYAAGAEVSALTVQDAAPKQKGPTAVGPFCFRERYCVLTIMLRMRLVRSEEHTSELQSLMRISYAVFCLKKKNNTIYKTRTHHTKNIDDIAMSS